MNVEGDWKGKGKKRVHELNFLCGRFEFLSTAFYVLSGCVDKLFLSWALPFFIHSLECGVYDLFHVVHLLVYFASKPHRITCFILVINETNRTETRFISSRLRQWPLIIPCIVPNAFGISALKGLVGTHRPVGPTVYLSTPVDYSRWYVLTAGV